MYSLKVQVYQRSELNTKHNYVTALRSAKFQFMPYLLQYTQIHMHAQSIEWEKMITTII